MVGQKHNDSVMWNSLLNKKKKTSWVAARAEALESLFPVATSPRLTGFCCHGTSQRVWWRTFYGESRGLPLSGWSTLQPRCSVLSAIWNSLLRRLSPRSLQCGGNSYTRPTQPSTAQPTQCGRDNTHVSAIPQGWDVVTVWREHNERACCCERTTNYRLHLRIEPRAKNCLGVILNHVGAIRTQLEFC